ncbi:response regulator receiver protein [Candidatus Magnetomorum sp. HK-1]|nr:response regulator receiver protein [Candidatus Magnetomorum sp. HK-1]
MEKIKIMLVDDEKRFLETTAKLLNKKGMDVITAESGVKALEVLILNDIHIVILDVKMPGMDGIETLKKIKANFPLVEVIMLTGHGTMDSAIDGLKAGASDYLIKPAEIDELIRCVKKAFEKRQAMDEKIRMALTRSFIKSPREIINKSYSE